MFESHRVGNSGAGEAPLFALLHGSWHGAWCWKDLEFELLAHGYDSHSVEFYNNVPGYTFEDHAEEAYWQIKEVAQEREVVVVAHSRAANIAPRLAGALALKHIVYLCGSFERSTLLPLEENRTYLHGEPRKYNRELLDAFTADEWGMSEFNREEAAYFFFHDCSPEVQKEAVMMLRSQFKTNGEPPLDAWPDQDQIPQTYVVATADRVISPAWSRYIAEHVLQTPLVEIESSHSPFLSQPKKLAALLINLTMRNTAIPTPRREVSDYIGNYQNS